MSFAVSAALPVPRLYGGEENGLTGMQRAQELVVKIDGEGNANILFFLQHLPSFSAQDAALSTLVFL